MLQQEIDLKKKFFSWQTWLSFTAAFFVLYLMITRIDPAETWNTLKHVRYQWYVAAFAVYYLAFPLRAVRFRMMLSNNGVRGGVGPLTGILLLSWFANCIVPAKLGDLYRSLLVRQKYGLPFLKTVGIVFVERVFDLVVLYFIIGLTGLASFHGRFPHWVLLVLESGFIIILVLIILTIGIRFYAHNLGRLMPAKVKGFFDKFISGSAGATRHTGFIALVTSLIWLMEGCSFYLVAKSLGLQLGIVTTLFVALMSALLTALPLTPAGLGIVEAAKVGVLLLFGQAKGVAVSAALLDRLINYWSLIIVGAIIYIANPEFTRSGGTRNESYDHHTNL